MSLKSIVLAAALFFSALSPAYAGPTAAPHFHSEQEAKQHCPHDSIVWGEHKDGGLSPEGRTLVWGNQGRGVCLPEGSRCRR